ncbi:MAG: TetR/AcrR family transcriptional regulator [Mycobacteriaceae bacterium]|nr:TetR/AcrR family transcriptional regulator [Mycobacteriaceae bacterium]
MTDVADRPLRADAARNAERILRAARDVYGELGAEAPMEAIARRAGVGERTLYRRFPTKGDLINAALDQSIAENLTPVIEKALDDKDPMRGLVALVETAISLGAREHHMLTAARRAGALRSDVSAELNDALARLIARGRKAGVIRTDVVADDLPRFIAMLYGVLSTMDSDSDGWRRYVALLIDSISTGARRRTLPRAVPLRFEPSSSSWP